MRFGNDFEPIFNSKKEPRDLKIEILCSIVKNQGFAAFSPNRLRRSMGSPFGLHFGSLLASRWLLHGFQSCQEGSKTTQGASKTPLICRQSRPSTSQDASKTAPRLSKSLQDGSVSLQELSRRGFLRVQAVSKSSLEELPKPPTSALPPRASGLQVASAGSAKRKFAVPSGVLDPGLLILLTSYLLRI